MYEKGKEGKRSLPRLGPRVIRRHATYERDPVLKRINRGYLEELEEKDVKLLWLFDIKPGKLRLLANQVGQLKGFMHMFILFIGSGH